jgi:DNA topoisomerase I
MRLRHASDAIPGISRLRQPGGFVYRHPDGSRVVDAPTLERIRKMAIPPAYEGVWICPFPNGHLQAVGRDARGRKQYRYHPLWRSTRDGAKYDKLVLFGRVLPKLRQRVSEDLSLPGLPRARVLAAVVRLLETTLARVGNAEYARSNGSFGLTTLRNRHVRIKGSHLTFDFRGKHGIKHNIDLQDRRLVNVVRRCRELPGQDLFGYLDDDGAVHVIGSHDVNEYLQDISGEEITAKDFRTWAGTSLAAVALRELEAFDSEARAKRNTVQAVEAVAKLLGNTPAICRKCYIHPAIFEGYLDGSLLQGLQRRAEEALAKPESGLSAEEISVMAFLSRRLPGAAARRARPERRPA